MDSEPNSRRTSPRPLTNQKTSARRPGAESPQAGILNRTSTRPAVCGPSGMLTLPMLESISAVAGRLTAVAVIFPAQDQDSPTVIGNRSNGIGGL